MVCEPIEVKRTPKTSVDAQFSIPWTIAVALVYGKVLIKDFTPDGIKDNTVLQLTQKISAEPDDSLTGPLVEPAIVEGRTKDGRAFSRRVDHAYGSPQNPMNWDDYAAKFEDCATWAAKPIPEKNLTKVIGMCKELETVDDIRTIIRLLS